MDKFEKRLNQVNMGTPKNPVVQQSTMKQTDAAKSYASFNDFNKMGEQYDNEAVNLRSQVQILEGKLQFYEREFQIKQVSLEKRIQQLISTSSQLTQQNTQLKLQYSALLNEYQLLQEKLIQQEKGQKEYEEKVRSQFDGLNKFQIEKEQLIQYANKCRERSKQRKVKVKDLTAKVQELQEQVKQFELQYEQANIEKQQIYDQFQQQFVLLSEQNEDWQLKYEAMVENFKNHLANQNDSQQEEQLLATHTILDQQEAETVQQQLENLSLLNKELNQLLSQLKNANQINSQVFEMPQIKELADMFSRMIDKLMELQQKKTQLKEQLKVNQFNLQQQISIKSSSGNQSPNVHDERTKMLFEQRILELEQFYQKDKKQEKVRSITQPKSNDRKLQQVMSVIVQMLEEFLTQQQNLSLLNHHLNDMQQDPNFKPSKRSFKVGTWVIIAINRIKRIKGSSYYQQFVTYKKLKIEMPIVDSLNQILELVTGQQSLIDTLQRAIEQKGFDGGFQEQEIQQMVDQELRQQLMALQIELDNNNKKMMEYKLKSEQDIEQRDQLIEELQQQLQELPNDYNQELLEHLDDQNNRVKNIENEFNVLQDLVNSLM
ncbi:unnamed protein product (macronuclear) [Paramecium tetraurelia]|uniref:Uncharacterized protein n=1 Tax=Paramecium tetraurelia TaxID=5888 RepID=A0D5H7_PARTE|nr:uncharacterized protein GSPATT00039277001 [Paramecium tetraurelia]CAK78294.1 unnamed protein product [Paramecium tetraurelia]|eukprot:XP_001445691.1 hypothetical protein (macronuclear) [Paramecium tetraurelia strain d4-2]